MRKPSKPMTFGLATAFGIAVVGGIIGGVVASSGSNPAPAHKVALIQKTADTASATTSTTAAPVTTTTLAPPVTTTTLSPQAAASSANQAASSAAQSAASAAQSASSAAQSAQQAQAPVATTTTSTTLPPACPDWVLSSTQPTTTLPTGETWVSQSGTSFWCPSNEAP